MTTVLHIGPPKTATSSLQETVIPQLGRPYQLKPDWVRSLTRDREFDPPPSQPTDVLLSDERLGTFWVFPPDVIADRLARIFKNARVIYIVRDVVELFYSFYRQALINDLAYQGSSIAKHGTWFAPETADSFFDMSRNMFSGSRNGFFSVVNINAVRIAFERYFDFTTIEFELLKEDPKLFVSAFARACGSERVPSLSHANLSHLDIMRERLKTVPAELPDFARMKYEEFYSCSRLSSDREEFLRSFRYNRELWAFASSFRLKK